MDVTTGQRARHPDAPPPAGSDHRQPPEDLLTALHGVKRPYIVGHVTPDADAIAAILSLCTALRDHDIDAVAGLTAEAVAMKLRFMFDLASEVVLSSKWRLGSTHDSIIAVDTAAKKRININPKLGPEDDATPIFNIDHHVTNTHFGRYNWVDSRATSTSELIARLMRRLGWDIKPNVASLLYAGIHGDTVGFSMPSTSASSLHTAGDLVQAGADVTRIGEQLCRSQAKPEFELIRRAYDHTTVADDGRIAYSTLTYQDITESRCTAEDVDDQVSIPRSLKNVRIALLFSEGERGVIRVNLRGEGTTTVVEIAQQFNGGGHTQSAGIRFNDRSMEQAIKDVVAASAAHLRTY